MALLSASMLHRAEACPASVALPRTGTVGSDDTTWGTVAHAALEAHTNGTPYEAPAEYADRVEALAQLMAALPQGEEAESEVAFAYDVDADRADRLVLDGPRSYPRDGRIVGTADLVGRTESGVFVADYKTGNAPRARDSLQLAALALFAARYAGADAAEVALIHVRSDGRYWVDRHALDALDLDDTRDRLVRLRDRAQAAVDAYARGDLPRMTTGDHCTYCPAQRACPAIGAAVRALVPVDVPDAIEAVKARMAAMSDEEMGAAWPTIVLAEKVIAAAKATAQERARAAGGLVVAPGKVLREVPWTAEKMSDVAKERLAAVKDELRAAGEIRKAQTTQVRVVNAKETA